VSASKTVVVIGGGHAGVEAALAAKRAGASAVLVTAEPDAISLMPCNPALGGVAKGTLIREIDALGGAMAAGADETSLQFRMLNMRKGPAVWGPRVQADSLCYPLFMRKMLDRSGIRIVKGLVVALRGGPDFFTGAELSDGGIVPGDAFVLATGTYLGGVLFMGGEKWPGGRYGGLSSRLLDSYLKTMFHVERFKTGTSPRVVTGTIRTDALEIQDDHDVRYRFSLDSKEGVRSLKKCHLARTNRRTAEAVRENAGRSPLIGKRIGGVGPRYCPSFEDKVMKFPERHSHPIHIEPVSETSRLSYINGLSTSMPQDVQYRMLRSIDGFEKAEIAAFGYAVEYSRLAWGEFGATLMLRGTDNLFAAGQILGTSGYEEAGALGLLAGANAARVALGFSAETPDRRSSYLGVMVDDLVAKGIDEPYRLFSSRAENRLHLRQDNAHLRMNSLGVKLGVLRGTRLSGVQRFEEQYEKAGLLLSEPLLNSLCRRPEITRECLEARCSALRELDEEAVQAAIIHEKYKGYVRRQDRRYLAARQHWNRPVPAGFRKSGISFEAVQAIEAGNPETLEEAFGLPGVKAADMEVLTIYAMAQGCST